MFNRRSPICVITSFLSLLSITLVMTIIRGSDGSMAVCNSSTMAECQVFEDEEQEFMMDTEEHKRMLATAQSDNLVYNKALIPPNLACHGNDNGCVGLKIKYNVARRQCEKLHDRCK
ncbi:hypothetical protein L2E82_19220 [Cichorium intybus]|uniref:Uncharacterized protein n=1 Tax=Cichorium intybus TaxID=13427 RepID=A0ACB9FBH7_CICIN|nr:hypothetical protein L2E82_19220 [Cichorium intybus]